MVRLTGSGGARGDWPSHVLGGGNEGVVDVCECVGPRQ